ncbi:MAG: toprim domain-containing protein [Patescibacteria group bacterium]|nr:toprim domain-containing protein [Patescibacteria group bacterium]MDE2116468.1 toprim domain-containing protein [Patescibacteria group bacterium]
MDHINRLSDSLRQFPGIGPRQAKRFVYFLLGASDSYRASLAREIVELSAHAAICSSCYRFFDNKGVAETPLCAVCRDASRDKESLMIVAKDVDLDAVEKSKVYSGYYFVLGNTLSLVDKDPDAKIRTKELIPAIEQRAKAGLKEIILALSLNAEGEHTREFVENLIAPLIRAHRLKVSILGRGLSTGTELEYSDAETIKNALIGRKQETLV